MFTLTDIGDGRDTGSNLPMRITFGRSTVSAATPVDGRKVIQICSAPNNPAKPTRVAACGLRLINRWPQFRLFFRALILTAFDAFVCVILSLRGFSRLARPKIASFWTWVLRAYGRPGCLPL